MTFDDPIVVRPPEAPRRRTPRREPGGVSTAQFNARISLDLNARLEALAHRTGTSRSMLARFAIEKLVEAADAGAVVIEPLALPEST